MDTNLQTIITSVVNTYHPEVSSYLTKEEFEAYIKGIIKRESSWKIDSVKEETNVNDYSIGLMQLRIETAKWNNPLLKDKSNQEIYDLLLRPDINITTGTKYFVYLLKRYNGNIRLSIGAYNSGTALFKTPAGNFYADNSGVFKIENSEKVYINEYTFTTIQQYKLINESYVNDIIRYSKSYMGEVSTNNVVLGSIAFGGLIGFLSIWLYRKFGR